MSSCGAGRPVTTLHRRGCARVGRGSRLADGSLSGCAFPARTGRHDGDPGLLPRPIDAFRPAALAALARRLTAAMHRPNHPRSSASQGSQGSRPKSSDWSRQEPRITIVPSCPGRKCTSAQRSVGQSASAPYAGRSPDGEVWLPGAWHHRNSFRAQPLCNPARRGYP